MQEHVERIPVHPKHPSFFCLAFNQTNFNNDKLFLKGSDHFLELRMFQRRIVHFSALMQMSIHTYYILGLTWFDYVWLVILILIISVDGIPNFWCSLAVSSIPSGVFLFCIAPFSQGHQATSLSDSLGLQASRKPPHPLSDGKVRISIFLENLEVVMPLAFFGILNYKICCLSTLVVLVSSEEQLH